MSANFIIPFRRTIRGRSCAVAIAGCVCIGPSGLSNNVLLLYSLPHLLLLQGDVTAAHLRSWNTYSSLQYSLVLYTVQYSVVHQTFV
jgi:hypothetical protein